MAHLGSGHDNSFPQILAHEGESRGGVAHGVRPMQDHKAVKHLVPSLDVLGNLGPVVHGHVAGVQQGVVLIDTVDDAIAMKCQPARCMYVHVCSVR